MIEHRLFIKGLPARKFTLAALVIVAFVVLLSTSLDSLGAAGNKEYYTNFLPMVSRSPSPDGAALTIINQARISAGVPPIGDDGRLNTNCFEHARYMAKNNLLAHDQNPKLPFASTNGQNCAHHANTWLGDTKSDPGWAPYDPVQLWLSSVGHRLWLLYPTTETVGYGFFDRTKENRAAAAIDILSYADFEKDKAYGGWPVRYPQENSFVPTTRFPVTLLWPYFGPRPVLSTTRLQTAAGQSIPHAANTNLPAKHKGIQIIPKTNLPPKTKFVVIVSGEYDGQPFRLKWTFYTGS